MSNYLMMTAAHVLPAAAQIKGFQPLFRYKNYLVSRIFAYAFKETGCSVKIY
ncbi:hypothetical protein [Sporosarcina sp. P2]|uniref:hypothetical protein n=1 Tax=Sporosarcina sp. P2 TaxID=2048251 RepID=UPI001303F970|nr:hypothetical protein [Sporosarcina sp. P2]